MPKDKSPKSPATAKTGAAASKKPAMRQAIDRNLLKALMESLGAQENQDDPIHAAQALIYDAWEAPTKARRIALARKALAISPHCADAYVLLAREEAKTPDQAREFYEQAVKAGEAALGPEGFKEFRGHFWGFLETRPYMRARAGLAVTLTELGDDKGASAHLKDMLKLNPNDNQGLRYLLSACLLRLGEIAALKALFKKYRSDSSADWLYSRALIALREGGESEEANALARKAHASNRHVPALLAKTKRPKPPRGDYITVGGEDEAAFYVAHWAHAWKSTEGAVDWLVRITAPGKTGAPTE